MIHYDSKTQKQLISGAVIDILLELGHVSSAIEEALSKEVGVEDAEKMVDDAIRAGREFNHQFVFERHR